MPVLKGALFFIPPVPIWRHRLRASIVGNVTGKPGAALAGVEVKVTNEAVPGSPGDTGAGSRANERVRVSVRAITTN
ncbi:MAG: hypothetical protein FJW40_24310 [Acidobacteria bacterium]|nr:hypothetical protein [Acidobacteriota bacterium]